MLPDAVALYRERYGRQGKFENTPYMGIAEGLARLERRTHLYVATSKPTHLAEDILSRLGLRKHFRAVQGSGRDGSASGKGEVIARLLRQEELAKNPVCMIGDRRHDLLGAQENGLSAYGVAWGFGLREELETAGPLAIFETPEALTQHFLKGNQP